MKDKKIKLGQFFTVDNIWLKKQVLNFIKDQNKEILFDPFAGNGDIFKALKSLNFHQEIGYDIDKTLNWEFNDFLLNIKRVKNSIIVTNPPYLSKQTATRKKIDLNNYFLNSQYDDIYLIALEKMLENNDYVVAIIPESFLNSNFKHKNRLNLVTILEENPFLDTEVPVCVACFDNNKKDFSKIKLYKNEQYLFTYQDFEDMKIKPNKNVNIIFNDKNGWLALRAIDSSNDKKLIRFDFKNNIKYDWENKIRVSSRHLTLIDIDIDDNKKDLYIDKLNEALFNIRNKSQDIILTPFKVIARMELEEEG